MGRRRSRGTRTTVAARALLGAACVGLAAMAGRAASFTIATPGGPVEVEVTHVDPGGKLVSPSAPITPSFRPPTIFSAPLPCGSGARALGVAGAFTAIADDATAASWNPAALIQLERPEASVVLRASSEVDEHTSASSSYRVGRDAFANQELNYFSAAYPFRVLRRNAVFSINYQEAYDFTQRFTADLSDARSQTVDESSVGTYDDVATRHYTRHTDRYDMDLDVTTYLRTHKTETLHQLLSAGMLSDLEFEQGGILDAVTPALAVELTPKLSLGAAVNVHQQQIFGHGDPQSRIRAAYSGTSDSGVTVEDLLRTEGVYTYAGTIRHKPSVIAPHVKPGTVAFNGGGAIVPFEDRTVATRTSRLTYEGVYEERNDFDGLRGINATLGVLWTVSRHLSLGGDVDLPWKAEGSQTKTVRNTITTTEAGQVVDVTSSESTVTKSVAFTFPLYWAVGGVWRWTDRFYTSLDVSETLWSDFAFEAEGEGKLSPLDGSPYGAHPVDDCWAVRAGAEYLLLLKYTEIPLRAGVSWEQRPAVGAPDEYWGIGLGTGVSIGQDPGKLILDFAYMCTWGDDVLESLVPDQKGLTTDVVQQQFYASAIYHF